MNHYGTGLLFLEALIKSHIFNSAMVTLLVTFAFLAIASLAVNAQSTRQSFSFNGGSSKRVLHSILSCPCSFQLGLRFPSETALPGNEFKVYVKRRISSSHKLQKQIDLRSRRQTSDNRSMFTHLRLSTTSNQSSKFRYSYGPHIYIPSRGRFAITATLQGNLAHINGLTVLMRNVSNSTRCPVKLPYQPPVHISRVYTQQLLKLESSRNIRTSFAYHYGIQPQIVGGDVASEEASLFVVSLTPFNKSVKGGCTGALLSSRWVVSAAHCKMDATWVARPAASDLYEGNGQAIEAVFPHGSFSSTNLSYDISLIKLKEEAPSGAKFVRVNADSDSPHVGNFARALGYGNMKYDVAGNTRLRQVDIPVNELDICRQKYRREEGDPRFAPSRVLCAGYIDEGGCDACQGDSGGPLIQFDGSGNVVQVGIISWGYQCARPNFPGIYVRLSAFIEWMRSKGAVFEKGRPGRTSVTEASSITPTPLGLLSVSAEPTPTLENPPESPAPAITLAQSPSASVEEVLPNENVSSSPLVTPVSSLATITDNNAQHFIHFDSAADSIEMTANSNTNKSGSPQYYENIGRYSCCKRQRRFYTGQTRWSFRRHFNYCNHCRAHFNLCCNYFSGGMDEEEG